MGGADSSISETVYVTTVFDLLLSASSNLLYNSLSHTALRSLTHSYMHANRKGF